MRATFEHFIQQSSNSLSSDNKQTKYKGVSIYKRYWKELSPIDLMDFNFDCKQLPESLAKSYNAIIFHNHLYGDGDGDDNKHTLHIALSNPLDHNAKIKIAAYFPTYTLKFYFACQEDMNVILETLVFEQSNLDYLSKQIEDRHHKIDISSNIEVQDKTNSLIGKIFEEILLNATLKNSTDIHIEAKKDKHQVSFRTNHKLQFYLDVSYEVMQTLKQYLLVRGNGDLAKLRTPQDFTFFENIENNSIGLRCSYMPTMDGFSIVIRIHYYRKMKSLHEIVPKSLLQDIQCRLKFKRGIYLVTGTTNSGKTTFMYSMLEYIASMGNKKIITLEDSVESYLSFANQVEVTGEEDKNYADYIRAALRQDPDVLMISEIRDEVSANMLVRAALSGITILSTVHVSSPIHIINRLINLNVDPADLAICMQSIVGSNILPKLCDHCKKEIDLPDYIRAILKEYISEIELKKLTLWSRDGCAQCQFQGFYDYIYLLDYIKTSSEIRENLYCNHLGDVYLEYKKEFSQSYIITQAINAMKNGEISAEQAYEFIMSKR